MHKFIAIGDVHADFPLLWAALRGASCLSADFRPTPPVLAGAYQVVLIGDLVHPKNQEGYNRLTGLRPFDPHDQDHLERAAQEQVSALRRLQQYQQAAPHAVHIILGNHDANVLDSAHLLGTSGGLRHVEFDPERGGVPLPQDLRDWFSGFPRELRVGGLQFAHVSPLPAHQFYDDLFYSDRSSKRWFHDAPEYVDMAGLDFGVYGHTQIEDGILLHRDDDQRPRFAMIDALHRREYLEILYDEAAAQAPISISTVPF